MIDKTSGLSSSPGDALRFSAMEESCSLCLQPQLCFHLLPPLSVCKEDSGTVFTVGTGHMQICFYWVCGGQWRGILGLCAGAKITV